MKYKGFVIEEYKAVRRCEINIKNPVIPIIGVNESGKTTILHGILAFDKTKDSLMDGAHIDPSNKYLTKSNNCKITAELEYEDETEFEKIGAALKLKMGTPIYDYLKAAASIHIERNLSSEGKPYAFCDGEITKLCESKEAERILNYFIKILPNILYFDDFNDRVPEEIVFPPDYASNQSLSRGKQRQWQELIEEIFARALDEDFSLIKFFNLTDDDTISNYNDDITDCLHDSIVKEWEKFRSANFSSDNSDLQLVLAYKKELDAHRFVFKVKDTEADNRKRQFNIQDRSKGFQWFFNFIIKLQFNPKYKINPKNAIYLLDEPGSYLHSSAQTELLKNLVERSKENTILYCTHSQYLLDPNIINLAGIKVAKKEGGEIQLFNYGEMEIRKNLGAFTPLIDALHLKFKTGVTEFQNCILTEGIVDYCFFKMFLDAEIQNVAFIPGHGAGQLCDLISLLIGSGVRFLVILDNDKEGRASDNKYANFFKDAYLRNRYLYNFKQAEKIELEDILSEADNKKITDETGCKQIKDAIIKLFYGGDEQLKLKIKQGLDKDSKRNLKIVSSKIDGHFRKRKTCPTMSNKGVL